MSYRTRTHSFLQQLTSMARRAHQWASVQPANLIVDHSVVGYLRHAGQAY